MAHTVNGPCSYDRYSFGLYGYNAVQGGYGLYSAGLLSMAYIVSATILKVEPTRHIVMAHVVMAHVVNGLYS